MRYFILVSIFFTSCTSNHPENVRVEIDTVYKHDTIYLSSTQDTSWQNGFNLTHNPNLDTIWYKPASYYLDNPECATIAYEFYYGYFRPSDNGATEELLKHAVSNNNKLRPFYRWCLNKTLQVSDGALTEIVGKPAINYAIKFPEEFFEYMDEDKSGNKYKMWISAISYSGINSNKDSEKSRNIKKLETLMISNCKTDNISTITRIKRFARDCYE